VATLRERASLLDENALNDRTRRSLMDALGGAASDYRETVYASGLKEKTHVDASVIAELVALGQRWVKHTIAQNRRDDGLYQSYNLLAFHADGSVGVQNLYEMLEGQVAVMSTRAMSPEEGVHVLAALTKSRMYRPDQNSFTLYPDRKLPLFLAKNVIKPADLADSPVLGSLLAANDGRIVRRDAQGNVRFHADFYNADKLSEALQEARKNTPSLDDAAIARILDIYERTFDHRTFTGRSGSMFAYEGLGSIYWHMVAKLLLAASERLFAAVDNGASPEVIGELSQRYYAVREGLGGFNKTPSVYGAFPLDPYSHTPSHTGARQPGMTGQVKEEVITRFAELGVRVHDGLIEFRPLLLRKSEFLREPSTFDTFDVSGKPSKLQLAPGTLGFSYCGVPVVYHLADQARLELLMNDGTRLQQAGSSLSPAQSAEVFERTGSVARIDVWTQAEL